jgi:N-acetylglucosaminyldiphosphoundecaprenol N-acetyl-beta-D-mannosaminyltransferase
MNEGVRTEIKSEEVRGSRSESSLPTRSSRVNIAGIGVDNLSEDEALTEIERLIAQGGSHYMAVVNASKMVLASRDELLRQILAEADLVTADGMSVVWASRLLGRAISERVTGIDMFEKLVARAAETGRSIYFLGAKEHSLRALVETLRQRHADLRVAGYRNGYFAAEEEREIAEDIKRSQADILFVAMGSPAQERLISSHLEATGVKFALGVGGSFDHIAGLVPRAPRWMQQAGLEWLHRLMREPRRLWRRYLVSNTSFIWLVTKQLLISKSSK